MFPSAAGGRGFNRGEARARVEVPLAKLGLSGTLAVRDLWSRAALLRLSARR